MPGMTIAEYMDRMIACLVSGGDLATISRDNSTGSNPQQDSTDSLLEDDCALVSETLQIQLDRLVIRMVHGDETPAAYIVVNPPTTQDLTKDLAIDEGLARLGMVQDPEDLAERYGREVAEEMPKEEVENESSDSHNSDNSHGNDRKNGNDEMEALRAALTADLQPLGEALAGAMQASDFPAMQAALRKISENMPELAGDAKNLTTLLAEQFTEALTQDTTDEV